MLAMAMKIEVIVVDNMNLHRDQYSWYADHYDLDNYDFEVVEFYCANQRTAELATRRSRDMGHAGPTYRTDHMLRLFWDDEFLDAIVVRPTFPLLGRFASSMVATDLQ